MSYTINIGGKGYEVIDDARLAIHWSDGSIIKATVKILVDDFNEQIVTLHTVLGVFDLERDLWLSAEISSVEVSE